MTNVLLQFLPNLRDILCCFVFIDTISKYSKGGVRKKRHLSCQGTMNWKPSVRDWWRCPWVCGRKGNNPKLEILLTSKKSQLKKSIKDVAIPTTSNRSVYKNSKTQKYIDFFSLSCVYWTCYVVMIGIDFIVCIYMIF